MRLVSVYLWLKHYGIDSLERVSARARAAEEAFEKARRNEAEGRNASMSAEQLKRYGACSTIS